MSYYDKEIEYEGQSILIPPSKFPMVVTLKVFMDPRLKHARGYYEVSKIYSISEEDLQRNERDYNQGVPEGIKNKRYVDKEVTVLTESGNINRAVEGSKHALIKINNNRKPKAKPSPNNLVKKRVALKNPKEKVKHIKITQKSIEKKTTAETAAAMSVAMKLIWIMTKRQPMAPNSDTSQ